MPFTALLSGSDHFKSRQKNTKHSFLIPLFVILDQIFYFCACFVAAFLDIYGKIWYGYEVKGLENIPEDKAALFIFYHGVLPIDMIFLPIRIFRVLGRKRMIRVVADRFLFLLFPGSYRCVKTYIFPGPASKCIETLKNGHMLAIAPGGAREAMFATKKYETIWNNRAGFARVAKDANAQIIPVFTSNIRQVFLIPQYFQRLARPLYERSRLPVVPFCGGFPVKLTTILGKPIQPDEAETAEDLAKLCQERIEEMISENQRFPARIINAIFDRVRGPHSKIE